MKGYEKNTGNAIVLIVDDVEINREILDGIIKDMGYSTVLAENGAQALERIREGLPNLVLTDISMPEMDGYELCSALKANVETRDIPIIFISAFDATEDIVKGFGIGGGDYITKPFIPELVRARVKVHLKLYEATLQVREANRRLQVSVKEQLKQMEQERKDMLYALAGVAAEYSSHGKDYIERMRHNCRVLAQSMQISPLFDDVISDSFKAAKEIAAGRVDIELVKYHNDEFGELVDEYQHVINNTKYQSKVAEEVANGNLTINVKPASADDVLGNSLKKLVEENHRVLSNINDAGYQVTIGASQVASASQSLAQGTTEQASAIEQITASIDEITEKTKQNASQANEAAKLVANAIQDVKEGNAKMQDMMVAMEDINKSSESISKIIKVIDDIGMRLWRLQEQERQEKALR